MATTCVHDYKRAVVSAMIIAFAWIVSADDVNWKTAADGDFNEPTNWEGGGVPSADATAVIDKTEAGYTVSLSSTPTSSPKAIVIGNSGANTTKVEIVGSGTNVTLDETRFKIKKNGVLRVADGAHLNLKALTATPSDPIFQGDNGQYHGDFILDNATMDVDWAHSYFMGKSEYDGRIILTNGAVLTFRENGKADEAYHMSGWSAARLIISDTSKLVAQNDLVNAGNGCSGQLAINNLELTGNAEIRCPYRYFTFSSPSGWHVGTTEKWRTSHVIIKDNAKIDNEVSNQQMFINDSGYDGSDGTSPASSTVVDYSTSWTGLKTYGMHIGRSANDATLNLFGATHVSNYGNGFNIGDPDGTARGRGTLNITNACVMNYSSGQYAQYLYAFSVGTSEFGSLSNKSLGRGTLNVYADAAITNRPGNVSSQSGCYFHVGASRGEGDVNQYGGTIAHRSRYQTIVGVRGGTGRYNVYGGLTDVESDVYVGGIPYERLQGVVEGIDHAADSTFRDRYDYLNKGATGTVHVAGGTFQTCSNLYVSAYGKGTVELGGDSTALLSAKDIVLSSTVDGETTYASDVKFTVGKNGTGVFRARGRLSIGDGARLTVSVDEIPDEEWVKLIEFGECEGEFSSVKLIWSGGKDVWSDVVRRTRKGVSAYWLHLNRGFAVIVR